MKRLFFGHTLAGLFIHTVVMILAAFFGSQILISAVNETAPEIQSPTEVKKEAILVLSPASALITKGGGKLAVQIVVYPGTVSINAVGVTMRYSANLKVVDLSRVNSFCTLYPEELVDSSARRIRIGCGAPNPGLTASAGVVETVVFQAISNGQARVEIDLDNSSVHANDGYGTNVLSRVEGAIFSITETKPATPLPKAVITSSPTHPDQNRWYSNRNPIFHWAQDEGVIGYATLLDQNPQGNPDPTVLEKGGLKQFSNLEEGVWYFHLRAKNNAGLGPISHFIIQIDATTPELNVQTNQTTVTEGEIVTIGFSSTDAETFLVKIRNESFETASSPLNLTNLPHGKSIIYIRAIDRAGNITERSVTVYVESENLIERFFDWLRLTFLNTK